jgi:hypothetical protein
MDAADFSETYLSIYNATWRHFAALIFTDVRTPNCLKSFHCGVQETFLGTQWITEALGSMQVQTLSVFSIDA